MKTPDEIKKAMRGCHEFEYCSLCPYFDLSATLGCKARRNADSLAYIQQLETERHQLLTRCERLERERDALLKDIGSAQGCICIICENYNNPDPGTGTAECNILGRFKDFGSDGALMCGQFKWRGVKEE